jgi:hypothetical protein
MVQNKVNENVKVYAVYDNSGKRTVHERLQPIAFQWRNRQYRVQDITYVWRENRGESDIFHYAVSDGDNVYELDYDSDSFNWTLSKVACEG